MSPLRPRPAGSRRSREASKINDVRSTLGAPAPLLARRRATPFGEERGDPMEPASEPTGPDRRRRRVVRRAQEPRQLSISVRRGRARVPARPSAPVPSGRRRADEVRRSRPVDTRSSVDRPDSTSRCAAGDGGRPATAPNRCSGNDRAPTRGPASRRSARIHTPRGARSGHNFPRDTPPVWWLA